MENELKMIGENMKSLEVAEEKALTREEKYQVSKRSFLIGRRKVIWPPIGSFQKEPGSGGGKGSH